MFSLLIRQVTPDDASGVAAILNSIIAARVYSVLDSPVSVEEEREFIRRFPTRGVFHVAEDTTAGRIVGFQNAEPVAAYTHAFDHVASIGTYVSLDRRRQGIATRLFEATFTRAVEKGYQKLFTFVRADNQVALATYLRQGFRIIGRAEKQARIDGRYIDEILIEKWLT